MLLIHIRKKLQVQITRSDIIKILFGCTDNPTGPLTRSLQNTLLYTYEGDAKFFMEGLEQPVSNKKDATLTEIIRRVSEWSHRSEVLGKEYRLLEQQREDFTVH